MDYQKDLEINKNRLDYELLTQAQKMMKYSSEHAQAQYNRDKAKLARDITEANLDAAIRAEFNNKQIKFTEAVVKGKILTSPTYIEAQEKCLKAEHEVNLLLGGVMAMNARRPMLESLVKLFLNSYWSEPRVAGGQDMRAQATQKATEDAVLRNAEEGLPPSGGEPTTAPSQPPTPVQRPLARPMPQIPPKKA